jgi:hypothetical protein
MEGIMAVAIRIFLVDSAAAAAAAVRKARVALRAGTTRKGNPFRYFFDFAKEKHGIG